MLLQGFKPNLLVGTLDTNSGPAQYSNTARDRRAAGSLAQGTEPHSAAIALLAAMLVLAILNVPSKCYVIKGKGGRGSSDL